MKYRRHGIALCTTFLLIAPGRGATNGDDLAAPVKAYLGLALDLLQQYDLHRKDVEWKLFRSQIMGYAQNAQTTQQAYPAIVFACTQLKFSCDLQEPANTPASIQMQSAAIRTAAQSALHGKLLSIPPPMPFLDRRSFTFTLLTSGTKRYVCLVIPMSRDFHTSYRDPRLRHEWAEDLNRMVSKAIQLNPQGWIVDLRGDRSGYTAPPLAGLQSLLGNGKVLNFRSSTNRYTTFIKNGAVLNQVHGSDLYVEERIDEAVSLMPSTQPIAILIDQGTENTGEIIAIAFKGRKRTVFIGKHTGGSTDQGAAWNLSDGAVLFINTHQTLDRNERSYTEGIKPDIQVEGPPEITVISLDPVVLKAKEWLDNQD